MSTLPARPGYVPNAPLRDAWLDQRTPAVDVCWWLHITRHWPTVDGVEVADVCKLKRSLGLIDSVRNGERFQVQTIKAELARAICDVLGIDYHELYPEPQEAAGICASSSCDEPLYADSPDGLCGFCHDERALGVAA